MSVSLKPYNTFGIDHHCRELLFVDDAIALPPLVQRLRAQGRAFMILGGGSNVLLTSDLDLTVVRMANKGIEVTEDEDAFYLSVAAGESWHGLVTWTLAQGMPGLENLALIPGSVGAAPIQNIGAYGVELKAVCDWVEYLSLPDCRWVTLTAEQCRFGYRDSIFKAELKDKAIITRVGFRLRKPWQAVLSYGPLAELEAGQVSPVAIYERVISIRNERLPDPAQLGNAGSFFKNPVLDAASFRELVQSFPDAVAYAMEDGQMKLAAAWLIDKAGLKGFRQGRVAVHHKQALVLVNLGEATGAEVCQLASYIIQRVRQVFGVTLEAEPNIVGNLSLT